MVTINNIEKLLISFNEKLTKINNLKELNKLRVLYMGRKGYLSALMQEMTNLTNDEKRIVGKKLNDIKIIINEKIEKVNKELEQQSLNERLASEQIDVTLPGTKISNGTIHPLTKVINEITELFIAMGYDVVEGPEIESDLYNFTMLNLPIGHPARDTQDSFYLTPDFLLRTQTSPVQVRTMLSNKEKEPIRIICPGKVYRRDDDDATHSHQFTQIEGLLIDKNISLAHLKGTLEVLVKKLFGENLNIRFRPNYFPFTEPSLEVDVSCFKCQKKGCSLCKNTGWIEILGAGMVHPHVLEMSGYDPNIYTGFAFGLGAERVAMLKYGISDIRFFYINDLRGLNHFNQIDSGDINEG
jgi:phenylalanyl-tRNA synthetase alpha chain